MAQLHSHWTIHKQKLLILCIGNRNSRSFNTKIFQVINSSEAFKSETRRKEYFYAEISFNFLLSPLCFTSYKALCRYGFLCVHGAFYQLRNFLSKHSLDKFRIWLTWATDLVLNEILAGNINCDSSLNYTNVSVMLVHITCSFDIFYSSTLYYWSFKSWFVLYFVIIFPYSYLMYLLVLFIHYFQISRFVWILALLWLFIFRLFSAWADYWSLSFNFLLTFSNTGPRRVAPHTVQLISTNVLVQNT